MTGKLTEKVSKITLTTTIPATDNVYVKRGRGRPKGAKNKPKTVAITESLTVPQTATRGRGRPKGAKNKPKVILAEGDLVAVKYKPREEAADSPAPKKRGRPKKIQTEEAKTAPVVESATKEDSLEDHPLFHAAKWLEKNMHQTEMDYCRRRASRTGVPLSNVIVADILGFFNVQNAEICKQVKKTNFLISNSNGLHN